MEYKEVKKSSVTIVSRRCAAVYECVYAYIPELIPIHDFI